MRLAFDFCMLASVVLMVGVVRDVDSVTCYVCESWKNWRCLDPFHLGEFIQMNCDNAQFVREKKPVFCEKRTEIVEGSYVTTRGCSTDFSWEDIHQYADYRGGHVPCIRRGGKETCLCTTDSCNSAHIFSPNLMFVPVLIILSYYFITNSCYL